MRNVVVIYHKANDSLVTLSRISYEYMAKNSLATFFIIGTDTVLLHTFKGFFKNLRCKGASQQTILIWNNVVGMSCIEACYHFPVFHLNWILCFISVAESFIRSKNGLHP